jgi:hypothetical protein
VKNIQQWCGKHLINNIYLMIHYNHIENLCKEVCDVVSLTKSQPKLT